MLLVTLLFPIVAGIAASTPGIPESLRNRLRGAVMLLTDLLGLLCLGTGGTVRLFYLTERYPLMFSLDGLGRFFLPLVLLVYTAATFYAFSYMKGEARTGMFFGFWFASLGAMLGVCLAGNLVSLYLCFELATLSSMPLVLHDRSTEAVAAALNYLFYSIGGALLGLFAVLALCSAGAGEFHSFTGTAAGTESAEALSPLLLWAVFAGIVGFGAKAGMYPLHGWLPAAHPVAPAPASALLSGIVAKAGIVAVIRLVYDAAGAERLRGTWVQTAWMCLALLTVFMGSMMAWREKVLKKRLAYSTVSQLSYIMLGLSLLTVEGLQGGLLHAAAHAASKGTLFLSAGTLIHVFGLRQADELRGVGRRLPITMLCFVFASLSLVGIPPMGGFLSKWRIASAALAAAPGAFAYGIPGMLLLSALLTAGYLFPVAVDAFFPPEEEGKETPREEPAELEPGMVLPLALLCLAALGVGLFGNQLV